MRHLFIAGSLVIILAFTAGCGSDESATETTPTDTTPTETTSTTPTESPAAAGSQTPSTQPAEPEGTVIEVTLAGGGVAPSGERVEAVIGEPITFVIDADAPGELHVHSAAGTEIPFEAGTSEHEIVIDQPGVIEVELHEPELVVVQLEVR